MKLERNLKLNMNRMNSIAGSEKAIKKLLFAAAAAVIMTGCAQASPGTDSGQAQAVEENGEETGAQEGAAQAATGENGAEAEGENPQAQENSGESASGPKAEKEQKSVTIVIPTVYEDVKTQEEADEIRDKNGYESAVLQEDGSLVIVMSQSQYDDMISDFKKDVDKGISEIIGTDDESSIEKIEYNDDYSVFTVTVSDDEIGIIERQAAHELIMYGTLYHVYTGNDVDQIRVDYVSARSGEIIETADSGDLDNAY